MKVGLISGHGAGDSGSVGCGYKEADLTIELVKLLDSRLKAKGIETVVYPYNKNAYSDCKKSGLAVNFAGCDYVLEVHFNACVNDKKGNGKVTGSEIYVTTKESHVDVEKKILINMSKIGFTNRGVKKENYTVINTIKNKWISSALIETCFIDDKDDMNLYIDKKSEVVDAIVKGIVDGFGYKEPAKKSESDKLYKVQVGSFKSKENANKMLAKLKKAGFDGCIVTK